MPPSKSNQLNVNQLQKGYLCQGDADCSVINWLVFICPGRLCFPTPVTVPWYEFSIAGGKQFYVDTVGP